MAKEFGFWVFIGGVGNVVIVLQNTIAEKSFGDYI